MVGRIVSRIKFVKGGKYLGEHQKRQNQLTDCNDSELMFLCRKLGSPNEFYYPIVRLKITGKLFKVYLCYHILP